MNTIRFSDFKDAKITTKDKASGFIIGDNTTGIYFQGNDDFAIGFSLTPDNILFGIDWNEAKKFVDKTDEHYNEDNEILESDGFLKLEKLFIDYIYLSIKG